MFELSVEQATWLNGNLLFYEAGSLTFKSRASQIGHSVANCLPPLRFFSGSSGVAQVKSRGEGRCKLSTLRLSTSSIRKDLLK